MQAPPDHGAGHARGFTLLEVMIALFILAMVLTAFQHVLSRSIDQGAGGRFLVEAGMLARSRMAEIQSKRQPVASAAGEFPPPFAMYRWSTEVAAPPSALTTAIPAKSAARLRLVRLSVFQGQRPERKVELAFLQPLVPQKNRKQ